MEVEQEATGGRIYRKTEQNHIYDWASFKDSWKGCGFYKQYQVLDDEQIKQSFGSRYGQLLEDQSKKCYLFPDSMSERLTGLAIEALTNFKYDLDYDYESLYMDQNKQLLIYKKRSVSLALYLSKYRLPNKYKTHLETVNEVSLELRHLMISRNKLISMRSPKQQIAVITKQLDDLKHKKFTAKLEKYQCFVRRLLKDFSRQPLKQQITFMNVNSLISPSLQKLSEEFNMYMSHRYNRSNQSDQNQDIIISKEKRDEEIEVQSFDDSNEEMSEKRSSDGSARMVENKIVQQMPKQVYEWELKAVTDNGYECLIVLPSFGYRNQIASLIVELAHPKQTKEQSGYRQTVPISVNQEIVNIFLHPLSQGYCKYTVTPSNQVGSAKSLIIELWNEIDQQSGRTDGTYNLSFKNQALYILGENKEGVIPNHDQSDNSVIITTGDEWKPTNFKCRDFDVSSQGIICNAKGDVASWGSMFVYDDETISAEDSEETQIVGISSLQIEKPSLILDGKYIRQVSCGEGYSLMADIFGSAWSFGVNETGQLGLGTLNQAIDTSEPTRITGFKYFITDVVASYHGSSFAIDCEGQAYRWGLNQIEISPHEVRDSYNNIINYKYENIVRIFQDTPLLITKKMIGERVKSVHPGQNFTLALTHENNLYGWGSTDYLQKEGNNSNFTDIDNLCNPIPVLKSVQEVHTGPNHCVALTTNKQLLAWGYSQYFGYQDCKFMTQHQLLRTDFHHKFGCGKQFTFLQQEDRQIEVLGASLTFKYKSYKLPFDISDIKGGNGVIVIKAKQ